ncbi:ribonuclease P protein subunit Rpp25 [Lycorma delicatula]|uniref:ribonuclease P protein subunit Rpp25 n=1 Tax=Lycorma delicatula TaxID=130591 RepID=UPI003F5188C6
MENYSKGKNVEEEWDKDKIPIPDLPENFTWMHVKGGSKMYNLLEYAISAYKETGVVLWSGSGAAVGKTVSCAEIMKKRHKGVHQINKICYRKVQEYWTPLRDDLDELVVTREIPTIHILLSKEQLNNKEPGYQAPNTRNTFWKSSGEYKKRRDIEKRSVRKVDSKTFVNLGLRSNTNKHVKNLNTASSS